MDEATDAALIAMGVIDAPQQIQRDTPQIPSGMSETYDHYLAARFGRAENKLLPREPLSYKELSAYRDLTGAILEPWQVGVIMSIDALFNRRSE